MAQNKQIFLQKWNTSSEWAGSPELVRVTLPYNIVELIQLAQNDLAKGNYSVIEITKGMDFSCFTSDNDLVNENYINTESSESLETVEKVIFQEKTYYNYMPEENLAGIKLRVPANSDLEFFIDFEYIRDAHYTTVQNLEELIKLMD